MAGNRRSGRRPQPAAIRELKGSKTRAHHRTEPGYTVAMPEAPVFIAADPIALARWQSIGARLVRSGVLTEAHGEMLALLCTTWADLERTRQAFAEMGYQQVVLEHRMTATGEEIVTPKANPIAKRLQELSYQVARFLGEFGLTPMTNAKVAAKEAGAGADPFAEFFDGTAGGDRHEVQ